MLKFKVNMVGLHQPVKSCPTCKGTDVVGEGCNPEGDYWWVPYKCLACNSTWDEILTPAFVTNVKKP